MEIYAPLADRMGMNRIRDELEDLSFEILNSEARKLIKDRLDQIKDSNLINYNNVLNEFENVLKDKKLKFQIFSREKTPFSIWRKIQKKRTPLELSSPKINNYKSIHTAIIGPNQRPIEIQLRTNQMHEFAQRGIASHWKYKSSEKFNSLTWKEYDWLADLVEIIDKNENPEHYYE